VSPDRPPSDRQICALNTIGQFIDINNIMPWLDVWFYAMPTADYQKIDLEAPKTKHSI